MKNVKVISESEGDTRGLKKLKEKMSRDLYARVGVLGGSPQRADEMGNAEIGLIHEFGSAAAGIPPRSFLRMPLEHEQKKLTDFAGSTVARNKFDKQDFKGFLQLLGIVGVEIVQKAFETRGFGQWAPNAPYTVERKGSNQPLIDTGQLRRSIMNDVSEG